MSSTVNQNDYQAKVDPHFSTKAIQGGLQTEDWEYGSVVAPIFTASTFKQSSFGNGKYIYGRYGNPARDSLEACLASLEGGKHGYCFTSGTAAIDSVVHLLNYGDHVICSDVVYGGEPTTPRHNLSKLSVINKGIETDFVDTSNLDTVRKSIKNNTKMIWIETPANPLLKLTDLAGIRKLLDESKKDIVFVVDNTFMTPYFQRPLNFGADIVINSLSKYINGHCDVIMGAVVTNRDDFAQKFHFMQKFIGSVPSPIDCYMVQRGIKTLAIRMREHMKNGLAVAKFLETHPCVEKVFHPGLPTHPQHQLALKQTSGSCGMLAFYIKGGHEECNKFLNAIKIFNKAGSLGGCESLATSPILITHANTCREFLTSIGITESLIRLSVGIEDIEDILNDVDQALRIAVHVN